MRVMGLTGSIASGKSTVADMLESMGVPVIDADIVSREVVEPGATGSFALRERFGDIIFYEDGTLNRKALADIIFSDDAARADVDAILHPIIKARIDAWLETIAQRQPDGIAVVNAALLIEADMHKDMDELWVVICDDEKRKKRLMDRDSMSEADAVKRMKSQMPQDQKLLYADIVIDNSRDIDDTLAQVRDALRLA